jgi:hypothetical protein
MKKNVHTNSCTAMPTCSYCAKVRIDRLQPKIKTDPYFVVWIRTMSVMLHKFIAVLSVYTYLVLSPFARHLTDTLPPPMTQYPHTTCNLILGYVIII